MLNYGNTAIYQPTLNYNQAYQNNYSTSNSNSNYYSQQNNINNITNNYYNNLFNNSGISSYVQAPAIFQDQSLSPIMQQQQMMFPQQMYQQSIMQQQQQMMFPQQGNSSGFMQQIMSMILPMLLGDLTEQSQTDQPTTVDQTDIEVKNQGVWGDPHFETKGKDGKAIKFDHKGTAGNTYNVFQGDGYEVDALYKDSGNPNLPRVMDKARIVAGKDVIVHNSQGQTFVNGKEIKDGATVKLNDGTKVTAQGANMILDSKDKDGAKINITSQDGYINIDPEGKFGNLGGILGTAINKNKGLTEEEANKFNITRK